MRRLFFVMPFLIAAVASAQTMTEVGASAAGAAIGSAGGKKISEGITSIFGKVDATSKKAAKTPEDNSKNAPLLEVGPGTPRVANAASGGSTGGGSESVPPPPASGGLHRTAALKPATAEPMAEAVPPPPPPPPAPQMTADDLKKVASGTSRESLLKLGSPASRITMSDDGHLMETFSYAAKETAFGRVKLTDGTVSSVEVW